MTPASVGAGLSTVGDCVRSLGAAAWLERLGEPEVQDLHRAIRPQLDVRRLEIPVDDALVHAPLRAPRRSDAGDRQRLIERDGTFRQAIRERRVPRPSSRTSAVRSPDSPSGDRRAAAMCG